VGWRRGKYEKVFWGKQPTGTWSRERKFCTVGGQRRDVTQTRRGGPAPRKKKKSLLRVKEIVRGKGEPRIKRNRDDETARKGGEPALKNYQELAHRRGYSKKWPKPEREKESRGSSLLGKRMRNFP